MNNNSEFAQLHEQINTEIEMLHLVATSPAMVGSHTIIAFRYKSLTERCRQLGQHVGEQEAFHWAIERMNEQ